jgi:CBS domain-containing protein
MTTSIASLMHRDVHCASIDDTVAAVERLLTDHRLSWVPVRDDSGPVIGVISTTDLLHFHAQARDALKERAWQLCTYKPITVDVKADLQEVARLMVKHRIHHAVVTQDGGMQGVVSALDFVERFARTGETH